MPEVDLDVIWQLAAQEELLVHHLTHRRDSLEQGDLSWSWPVSQQWNFVGRYNFSFRDQEVLEQFFGLEYESCCWLARAVMRHWVTGDDAQANNAFYVQLELKGLASVGSSVESLLQDGILGYQ